MRRQACNTTPPTATTLCIDIDGVRDAGKSLKQARENQKISLDNVSNAICLSNQQIQDIESGETKRFYGSRIFISAIKKYATFLGVTLDLDALILNGVRLVGDIPVDTAESPKDERTIVASPSDDVTPNTDRQPNAVPLLTTSTTVRKINLSPRWAAGFVAILAITLLIPFADFSLLSKAWETQKTSIAATSLSASSRQEEPTPVTNNAIDATQKPQPQNNTLVMSFDGKSWVQLVYADGKVSERIYNKGETESVGITQLRSLTIGNAPVTTLQLKDSPIPTEALQGKTKGAVMKLGSEDLRQLAGS